MHLLHNFFLHLYLISFKYSCVNIDVSMPCYLLIFYIAHDYVTIVNASALQFSFKLLFLLKKKNNAHVMMMMILETCVFLRHVKVLQLTETTCGCLCHCIVLQTRTFWLLGVCLVCSHSGEILVHVVCYKNMPVLLVAQVSRFISLLGSFDYLKKLADCIYEGQFFLFSSTILLLN